MRLALLLLLVAPLVTVVTGAAISPYALAAGGQTHTMCSDVGHFCDAYYPCCPGSNCGDHICEYVDPRPASGTDSAFTCECIYRYDQTLNMQQDLWGRTEDFMVVLHVKQQ